MKRNKGLSVLIAVMLLFASLALPVSAAEDHIETFDIANEGSGYQIHIPGFIELTTAKGTDIDGMPFEVDAIKMEVPKPNSDGTYTLFEITTDKTDAFAVDSYPGIYGEGQLTSFYGEFENGKIVYSIEKDLMDKIVDEVFTFDFNVTTADGEGLDYFYEINFVFDQGGSGQPAAPKPAAAVTAKPTSSKVLVNGKQVAFEAYNIGGNNYFKLRDLAMALNGSAKQFEVTWDAEFNVIDLLTETAYTPVGNELAVSGDASSKKGKLSASGVFLNGEEVTITAYNIGGNNYFKLRDIAKVINFAVLWDESAKTVSIDASAGYTEE
ncbi:hypothetical protein D3P08_15685 [Paenibacillus nanensis]|uniref:Copper amine oxidase N-terminal domain-containing protein n=1 Tax=Paenibacillus nanensis TaxID=393251 RepID=A0A3A1UUB4_9BACL|nr:hypothetical protein [Paenibacillus nanensis]RIX51854.1 hypothetical protein D3P08_15685 [Paenibacillus nanensis]